MFRQYVQSSITRRSKAPACTLVAIFAAGLAIALTSNGALAQTGTSADQESGYAGDTVVLQGGKGEYFIGGLPAGWRQIPGDHNDVVHERRWVPANQDPSSFKDSIVFQSLPQLAGMAPQKFFENFSQSYRERCTQLLSTDYKSAGNPNGFKDLSVILACTHNKETSGGEVTLFRGIAGSGAFYLIQRGWRLPSFTPEKIPVSGKQFDAATKAVDFGYACQIGNQTRPCPAGWQDVLSGLDESSPSVVFPAVN